MIGATGGLFVAVPVSAGNFNIPGGDLKSALNNYAEQTGTSLVFSGEAIKGIHTNGVTGDLSNGEALGRILSGTGFKPRYNANSAITIVPERQSSGAFDISLPPMQLAQASVPRATVETVTVTSSKLGGADVQSIPIAITALSQEQLTATQTAGGPDLVKQVPNLTFTKTNFTGYSIQIRGIGTQAISVTTDPAVAVALNDTPFIRNHFFEQEFYDLSQAEVLRGPQGTLYGRNATAGVVNLITAKPTDQFEAMASADVGNYQNRRFEGMLNIPIVDDHLDLRVAGEWTKRSGYTKNEITGNDVDGRDLWSSRVSIGVKPFQNMQATIVWEHFQEGDDRMRTAKQLCKTDPGPDSVGGINLGPLGSGLTGISAAFTITRNSFSQGCLPASFYSPESFEVPNGFALPYVVAGQVSGVLRGINPYANAVQSQNLRVIETQIDPRYKAKNDTLELNADYNITPQLTLTSQTGYNQDFLWSTEDYNRFNTTPGMFLVQNSGSTREDTLVNPDGNHICPDGSVSTTCTGPATGEFCDPQLGCSSRLVVQDISSEHAWQLSQEFRLASSFAGPLNFSLGGNYMHYETEENYYVFANTLGLLAATSGVAGTIVCASGDTPWVPGVSDNSECLVNGKQNSNPALGAGTPTIAVYYIDPNSLQHLNDLGHNYFLSQNPYTLNSYAAFGEGYYDVATNLKLTGGIRWTEDKKHFVDIPSELLVGGYGYATTGIVNQQWGQFTGRLAANWTPKLDFTDQTLVYGSFAHGYKAGGANPPGAVISDYSGLALHGVPTHPLTFKPEFINAYELGSKNTLMDGEVTLNGDVFFYDYKGYQISEIVDRTSINLNFDATVKGAELEATYEPVPGLRFKFAGGYEDTRIKDGQQAIDLMDRTAGHPGWVLMRPFVTTPSNCVLPDYVIAALLSSPGLSGSEGAAGVSACGNAYGGNHLDPVTVGMYVYNNGSPYSVNPISGAQTNYPLSIPNLPVTHSYPGYDPLAGTAGDPYVGQNIYNGVDYGPAPNNGEGFAKDLGGNQLPNAPHFTVSFSAEYTVPVSPDWAASLHSDFYWQAQSFARVFNDNPYDRIHGYTNVNLALVLTSQNGWQVMGYLKNVFDTTAITGAFLNSDDSGLTTNVFLTDPRLFGVRVTKNW